MNCPHCTSTATKERTKNTSPGYRTFCCSDCKRTFNERTGTPFNFLEYPTNVVPLVVLWRLRYKLSLRDLAEVFIEFSSQSQPLRKPTNKRCSRLAWSVAACAELSGSLISPDRRLHAGSAHIFRNCPRLQIRSCLRPQMTFLNSMRCGVMC